MDKHTFQVGDRVVIGHESDGVYSTSRCGKRAAIKLVKSYGYDVALDNSDLNRSDGVWHVSMGDLTHDTDFQVGDWVRYEGVDERVTSPKLEGKVGQVATLNGDSMVYVPQFHMQSSGSVLKENVVKIQPPQEAQVETVTIKHEKYGIVEGVSPFNVYSAVHGSKGGWIKDSVTYFEYHGWSQVSETEWVTIQVEKEGFDRLKNYENLYGYSDDALSCNEFTKWRYPQ